MVRKGVNGSCGCGWFEGILDRIAALAGRVDLVEQGKEDKLPDGSAGQVLATNGHVVYWKDDNVRDVVDDLTSHRTDAALSANQGRVLGEAVDDVQDYAEAIGENVGDIDTEIHTTRPYVDTTTDQTIDGIKTFDVVKVTTPDRSSSIDTVPNIGYMSATGADALNNLVHTNGNEEVKGKKVFKSITQSFGDGIQITRRNDVSNGWYKLAILLNNNRLYRLSLYSCTNNIKLTIADFFVYRRNNTVESKYILKYTTETLNMCVTKDSNNEFILWINGPSTGVILLGKINLNYGQLTETMEITPYTNSESPDLDHKPTTSDGYAAIYDVEVIQ